MDHRFGCNCASCTGRARQVLHDGRQRGTRYVGPRYAGYYATGDRVTLPPASRAGDMYYRFDWLGCPKPGELEYLRGQA